MQTRRSINIPVVAAKSQSATAQENVMDDSNCSGKDPVALMVMGDSMEPEFLDGEILVIEPDYPAKDGLFVIGWLNEEYIFRQLKREAHGGWLLHALNPAYPDEPISGLDAIRGTVTHKRQARSRKSVKFYVEQ